MLWWIMLSTIINQCINVFLELEGLNVFVTIYFGLQKLKTLLHLYFWIPLANKIDHKGMIFANFEKNPVKNYNIFGVSPHMH